VLESIIKTFPEDSIVSEEGSNFHKGQVEWIIDPIDGTTNFFYGYPAFCISIAYKEPHGIGGGVVYHPLLNELFIAERGKGAYLNQKMIKVNEIGQPSKNLIVMGFSNRYQGTWSNYAKIYSQIMPQVIDIRRTGSAALDLCYVACGRFGGYYEPAVKIWDIAAGSLILTEAGGNVTDRNGHNIEFSQEDYSILATNDLLHDWFLQFTTNK